MSRKVPLPGGAAGADKQVAFNDGGAFGAEAGFEYDKTTNTLSATNASISGTLFVGGAATFDDAVSVGSTSLSVGSAIMDSQALTASRTFAFPDAGGTFALMAGANKQVQFNDGGALGAEAGFEYDKTTDTLSAGNLTVTNSLTVGGGATFQDDISVLGGLNASSVAITGGTIDGTTVGATTKSTGAFTTLLVSSTTVPQSITRNTAGNARHDIDRGSSTAVGQLLFSNTAGAVLDGRVGYILNNDLTVENLIGGEIAFHSSGAERARITTTGINSTAIGATTRSTGAFSSVAIGAAAPTAGYAFDVIGNARINTANPEFRWVGATNSYTWQVVDADNRFRLFDATSGAERLTVTSAGLVGVGLSPYAGFIVDAKGAGADIRLASSSDAIHGFRVVGAEAGAEKAYMYVSGGNANHAGHVRLTNGDTNATIASVTLRNAALSNQIYMDGNGAFRSYSANGGIGYGTGAGGSVSQLTSKSTGVTLNRVCGWIVMHNAALAANTTVTFTLTNSAIAANTDVVVVNYRGATAGAYSICVSDVAAGSCKISLRNESGGSLSEAVGVNFAVIRGVAA